jgi:hypothetical protein
VTEDAIGIAVGVLASAVPVSRAVRVPPAVALRGD